MSALRLRGEHCVATCRSGAMNSTGSVFHRSTGMRSQQHVSRETGCMLQIAVIGVMAIDPTHQPERSDSVKTTAVKLRDDVPAFPLQPGFEWRVPYSPEEG